MRKNLKKAVCIFFAVLLLACSFPVSVFAVDPVSAGVMANAFAQAISAYGAANGVSLTFDVASTEGIGETVHELWTAFRTGTQDADDYETLAAALFPDLYYKTERILAGGMIANYVGMSIDSSYAEVFDEFYNWLLSGPAEMVQVDNSYYQFASSQIGAGAVPITVAQNSSFSFNGLPVFEVPFTAQMTSTQYVVYDSLSPDLFVITTSGQNNNVFLCSFASGQSVTETMHIGTSYVGTPINRNLSSTATSNGVTIYYFMGSLAPYAGPISTNQTGSNLGAVLGSWSSDEVDGSHSTLGVKAYGNTGIADIPDTADPNYDALHRARDIPLDTPWDDSLYGDGTLTGADSAAIAAALDDILIRSGILDLIGTGTADPEPPGPDEDPSDDPGDYGVLGLETVFPFCIPFDIYNFLSALAATPTPPHFTATLAFPAAVGGNQTIDIDFDNPTFNQLAQLLRLLELLAFIVGLALLTRSMFIRG